MRPSNNYRTLILNNLSSSFSLKAMFRIVLTILKAVIRKNVILYKAIIFHSFNQIKCAINAFIYNLIY